MPKKRASTTSGSTDSAADNALGLPQDALLHLLYDDPAAPATPIDTTRTDPNLFSQPAFGQATQHANSTDLAELESSSYAWTRNNYHKFVQHIEAIEEGRAMGLESNLDSQNLRDYVLKQLIGLSGHPDPKVATKALDMLAKSKYVGLYEEKRAKAADEMSMEEVAASIQKLLGK